MKKGIQKIVCLCIIYLICFTSNSCSYLALPSEDPSSVVSGYTQAINDLDFASAKTYLDAKSKKKLSSFIGNLKNVVSFFSGSAFNAGDLLTIIGPLYRITKTVALLSGETIPTINFILLDIEDEGVDQSKREAWLIANHSLKISNFPNQTAENMQNSLSVPIKVKYTLKAVGQEWKISQQETLNVDEIVRFLSFLQ